MTDTRTAAVEAITEACGRVRTRDDAINVALGARRAALEEVMEIVNDHLERIPSSLWEAGYYYGCKSISSAIRELIEKEK